MVLLGLRLCASSQARTGLKFVCVGKAGARPALSVGGVSLAEIAEKYGTPVYVVAEDDLRARARAFVQAGREAPNVRGDPAGLRTTELFDRDGDRALHDDQPRTTSW